MDTKDSNPFKDIAAAETTGPKKKAGSFQSLGLNQALLRGVLNKGYKVPTPIQRKSIPLALAGEDLIAMARTGSGKTAAFLIPILNKLESHQTKIGARALILSPTRELALQTLQFCNALGRYTDLRCCLLVGGDSLEEQFSKLSTNPDIIISTPGRLRHLLVEVEQFTLRSIQFLVFDEGDRLFEMGFQDDIVEILSKTSPSRQTLIFSATLPEMLAQFARAGLNNPKVIRLNTEHQLPDTLETEYFIEFISRDKQIMVFTATKHHAEFLQSLLTSLYNEPVSVVIYGRMDQSARKIHLAKFANRKASVMFVTDLAARGLDIPILDIVINYDFPEKPKLFVHRVGRAARAGRNGAAYSFVTATELPYVVDLGLFLGKKLPYLEVEQSLTYLHKYADDELHLGTLPRDVIENYDADIRTVLLPDTELEKLEKSMKNAHKLYYNTKASASTSSAKKAKEFNYGSFLHPIFVNLLDRSELEMKEAVASLKTFRPPCTIFELKGKHPENTAAVAMESKRVLHSDIITKKREKEKLKKQQQQLLKHRLEEEETAQVNPKKRTRKLALPAERKQKDFKDPNFFLSHTKDNYYSEKGLEMDSGLTNIEDMVMDLVPDDSKAIFKQRSMLHWDKKSKKYIEIKGKTAGKLIRNESGAKRKINLTNAFSGQLVGKKNIKKGKLYQDWVNKTRKEIGRTGEEEGEQSAIIYQEHRQKRRGKWQIPVDKTGKRTPKNELRSAQEITKERKMNEQKAGRKKRKRDGGQKGGGGYKGGKRTKSAMSYNYLYLAASGTLGALFGVFEAEVIAFSLLEISINPAFPYVFGVGFCLLSFALAWRIWVSVPGNARYVLLFFSAMVLASGIACFFLKEGLIKTFTAGAKVPLYAMLGISFAFTITYSFSEIANISPWDRCCGTNGQENPIFGSQQQIFALFIVSLLMGASFGLLFGLIDVEDGDISKNLETNTIYGIPMGFVAGALFGIFNEWYRQKKPEVVTVNHHVGPQEADALL